MIEEAPMWLLVPCAIVAWLIYAGTVAAEQRAVIASVRAQRREHGEVDDKSEDDREGRGTDEVTDQQAERFVSHGRIVHPRADE